MIRAALAPDAPAVRAIARAAYSPYIPTIGREPAPMQADFAAQIARGHVHVWQAPDARPTAFVVFFPRSGHMFLESVAVHPEAAGQGLGKALIAFCEAEALKSGLRTVRLYTNAAMQGPLRLYPRLGYSRTGQRREDGFDRVFFEKRL